MIPRVYFGERGGNAILLADEGYTDAVEPYLPLIESRDFYPFGTSGEATFTALYLMVTHSMATTLRVTPILDGVVRTALAQTVALTEKETRTTRIIELGLSVPFYNDGVEVGRTAMRGTRFAVRIEAITALGPGDLIFDGVDVEIEGVPESRAAEAI